MSKKRSKIIITIGVCIVVFILSVIIIKVAEYYNEFYRRTISKDDMNSFRYMEFNNENGSICLVEGKHGILSERIFGDKKIYMTDYDYVSKRIVNGAWPDEVVKINKADVNIYNLKTRELLKTIDLKEIMKKDMPSYKFESLLWVIEREGENPLLCLRVMEDTYPNKFAYIDLETEEVVGVLSTEEVGDYGIGIVEKNEFDALANALINEDEIGILKENNMQFLEGKLASYIMDYSYLKICLTKESIPAGDLRLYQEFPGLKDYDLGEDESLYICLDTSKSGPKELIELFLEEGQEISFEGCVLPAELSIDGVEHDINSFEDYYQWRDFSKF